MTIILDNGHGYNTAGKRSDVYNGRTLYEYEFARDMVTRIKKLCDAEGIKVWVLVPELYDVPLAERCMRANNLYATNKDCILVSIHANAGGGTGFEVWTSVGETKADAIAQKWCDTIKEEFPKIKLRTDRSDGDDDKESGFYILKHTKMPAILCENLFMDNKADLDLLWNRQFRDNLASAYVKFFKRVIK